MPDRPAEGGRMVDVSALTVRYGSAVALDAVDLSIPQPAAATKRLVCAVGPVMGGGGRRLRGDAARR